MPLESERRGAASFAPLCLAIFVGTMGYSMTIPIFTLLVLTPSPGYESYFAALGWSSVVVLGVLLAMYPIGQFMGSSIIGALSDRFGRKPILLLSSTSALLCYLAIAIALWAKNPWLLFGTLFLAGLSESNIAIVQSVVSDVCTDDARERWFGWTYLSGSLAFIVGPLVGGVLSTPAVVPWFGYWTPFLFVCLLLITVICWIALGFTETLSRRKPQTGTYLSVLFNLRKVVTARRLRWIYAHNFLAYVAIFGFFRVFPMYAVSEFHTSLMGLSFYIFYLSLPIVFVNLWFIVPLSRRFSAASLASASSIAIGLSVIVLILPRTALGFWFTLPLVGLSIAICMTFCAVLVSDRASANDQGSALGNNQSLQFGAEALSSVAGGALATITIVLPLWIVAAICILAGGILLARKNTGSINP